MRNYRFPIRKGEIFRSGKEINGLRGGVLLYAAQGILQIDTARAEKNPFRMETNLLNTLESREIGSIKLIILVLIRGISQFI